MNKDYIENNNKIKYLMIFSIILFPLISKSDFSISMNHCLLTTNNFKEKLKINSTDNWVFHCRGTDVVDCQIVNAKSKDIIFESKKLKKEKVSSDTTIYTEDKNPALRIFVNKSSASSFIEELMGDSGIRNITCSGKYFSQEDMSKMKKPVVESFKPKTPRPEEISMPLIGD